MWIKVIECYSILANGLSLIFLRAKKGFTLLKPLCIVDNDRVPFLLTVKYMGSKVYIFNFFLPFIKFTFSFGITRRKYY